MHNETRKLMKLLDLTPDDIYHIFCLALCISYIDGQVTLQEEQMLIRIGEGLGLTPDDVVMLGKNAQSAIKETSVSDVIAFSLARLKSQLTHEQLSGVKIILKYVALADHNEATREKELMELVEEVWQV